MIDPSNGTFSIDDAEISVSPLLTMAEFLSSTLGKGAQSRGSNDGWSRWNFRTTVHGRKFAFTLFFHGRGLSMVHFAPIVGNESWANWSVGAEQTRKLEYDRLLVEILGSPPYEFPWGSATAGIDLKTGDACMVVRYVGKSYRA
jgi:hypothetical protein